MANHYHDATGVLVLDRVTPVIRALFGEFHLNETYPGGGTVYIARCTDSDDPQWHTIHERLRELAARLDVIVPGNDADTREDGDISMAKLLQCLAVHFQVHDNLELHHLVEHHAFDGDVDLESLFLIAGCFNDGHNLAEIRFEGCWYCDKPRLFEFGGYAHFLSREVTLLHNSLGVLDIGQSLRKAIVSNSLDEAAQVVVNEIRKLLASISDESTRRQLCKRSLALLHADTSERSED